MNDSVGTVNARRATFDTPSQFKSGAVLPRYDLVYETYGALNANPSNACSPPACRRSRRWLQKSLRADDPMKIRDLLDRLNTA